MSNTKIWVAVVVVAIIALVGYVYPKADEFDLPIGEVVDKVVNEVETKLGALVGPNLFDHIDFNQSFTKGGQVTATTSTASTYILTTDELRKEVSYIDWDADEAITVTTMASTSAPFLGLAKGDVLDVILYNSGDSTMTFAAGTGIDIQEETGGALTVATLEMARLTAVKKDDTDILLLLDVYQVGD